MSLNRKIATLAAGFAAALGGCTAGRDYAAPTLPLASEFRAKGGLATTGQAWWRSFEEPTLDRLQAEALAGNLDVEQALARIEQARATLRGSESAQSPSAEVQGNLARRRQSLNEGLGRLSTVAPDFPRTVDRGQIGLAGSWDLDLAGGLRRRGEAARADTEGAGAGYDAVRLAITAEVADAYFGLRGAEARLVHLRRSASLLSDQRAIMAVRVRLGEAAGQDLERLIGRVEAALGAIAPVRAAAGAQRNRLAVLTGRSPSEMLDLTLPAPISSAPDPATGTPRDLLRNRPDVRVAEQRLIAANAAIGASLAEYYPNVSLSGLLGLDSNRLGKLVTESSSVLQGAFGLRWRLFDFGRIDAEVRAARGRERELLAAYREAVLSASEDVETAFERLNAARERVRSATAQVAAARAVSRTAKRAFVIGEFSRDVSLGAERELADAESALSAVREDEARAIVACHRALGSAVEGQSTDPAKRAANERSTPSKENSK